MKAKLSPSITPEYFTFTQAAVYTGVGDRLLREATSPRAENPLPYYRVNSKTKLIAREDLVAWMRRFRTEPGDRIADLVDEVMTELSVARRRNPAGRAGCMNAGVSLHKKGGRAHDE
jgi:hypothetical protein